LNNRKHSEWFKLVLKFGRKLVLLSVIINLSLVKLEDVLRSIQARDQASGGK